MASPRGYVVGVSQERVTVSLHPSLIIFPFSPFLLATILGLQHLSRHCCWRFGMNLGLIGLATSLDVIQTGFAVPREHRIHPTLSTLLTLPFCDRAGYEKIWILR